MCMNDSKLLLVKLLSSKWDNMKCKGRLRKSWGVQVDSLMKESDLPDKVFKVKIINKSLDKSECEEFEIALQHKSKLHIYKKHLPDCF